MNSTRKTLATPSGREEEARGFPWLEAVVAVGSLVLFFQLFPGVWWSVAHVAALAFGYVDVRGWTWRSYAVTCVAVIVALVILKNRQDNA